MEDAKLKELEERREKRLGELEKQKNAQLAVDLEARETLEEEHGVVAAVKVSRYAPGQPVRAFVRMPKPGEYKRYVDKIGRGVEKKSTAAQRAAQEELAHSCWVYPLEHEARAAMLESFPGLLTPLALAAASLAEGRQEEEGKD